MKIIKPTKVPILRRVMEFRRRPHFALYTDDVGTRCSGMSRENGAARASVWAAPTARTGVAKCATGRSIAVNDRVRMSETGAHAIDEGTKLDGTSLAIANGAFGSSSLLAQRGRRHFRSSSIRGELDSSTLAKSSARHAQLATVQES